VTQVSRELTARFPLTNARQNRASTASASRWWSRMNAAASRGTADDTAKKRSMSADQAHVFEETASMESTSTRASVRQATLEFTAK